MLVSLINSSSLESRLETLDTLLKAVWFNESCGHLSSFSTKGKDERLYVSDFPEDGDKPLEEVTVRLLRLRLLRRKILVFVF